MKLIAVIAVCMGSLIANSAADARTPPVEAKQNLASAEVVAVYPKEKRVLLKHGPITNLGMSEMTMEFAVPNPRMLKLFKRGKKIMFSAIMVKDDYIVTHVEAAR